MKRTTTKGKNFPPFASILAARAHSQFSVSLARFCVSLYAGFYLPRPRRGACRAVLFHPMPFCPAKNERSRRWWEKRTQLRKVRRPRARAFDTGVNRGEKASLAFSLSFSLFCFARAFGVSRRPSLLPSTYSPRGNCWKCLSQRRN